MLKQLGFIFNSDLCVGCKACEVACKNENKTPAGVNWRRVSSTSEGVYLSLSCNHCDSPECFRVCPQKAFSKRRDGIVFINTNRCDGCMDCVSACPYDAPQFDNNSCKASKCIFCESRLLKGLDPACIVACSTGALQMVNLNEGQPQGTVGRLEGFPNISLTKPSIRFYPLQPRERYWLKE